MDAAAGNEPCDFVQRRHHALGAIVVEGEVAVLRRRVAPADHEHRVATAQQELHQRIPRREIEDVVFHDPGWNQQHRLGMDLSRLRAVADQLHQVIAEHHMARRGGEVLAHLEVFGTHRRLAARLALAVLEEVLVALEQACPAIGQGLLPDVRVDERVAPRRHGIHQVAGEEAHPLLVDRFHAAGCFGREEGKVAKAQVPLPQQVQRRHRPCGIFLETAPAIGGKRRFRALPAHFRCRIEPQLSGILCRALGHIQLRAG